MQDTPTAGSHPPCRSRRMVRLQCLCHLLDTESILFPVRLHAFLAGGTSFPGFNPDAESTDYSQHPLELLPSSPFNTAVTTCSASPRPGPNTRLRAQAVHTELGPVTFAQFLNEWAAHDLNHTIQAQRALMQPFIPASGPWRSLLHRPRYFRKSIKRRPCRA